MKNQIDVNSELYIVSYRLLTVFNDGKVTMNDSIYNVMFTTMDKALNFQETLMEDNVKTLEKEDGIKMLSYNIQIEEDTIAH